MTRVTDDIGTTFGKSDVEWLLQEHDVFECVKPSHAQQARSATEKEFLTAVTTVLDAEHSDYNNGDNSDGDDCDYDR